MARWGIFDLNVWNTILASLAPSTRQTYENIFFQFTRLLDSKRLDFSSIDVNIVLNFLQSFVGKSKSRVRAAVAALKFFLKIYKREDLAVHPLISLFGKGAQNLAPLPRERSTIWNPDVVLDWLKTQSLPSSFIPCASEAVLLLLLATGWRVDDVWKLANKIEWSNESARLFFRLKRKCRIKGKFTLSQSVARLSSNDRICPVRALERFSKISAKVRKMPSDVLFVSSKGNPASKDTLRRWIGYKIFSRNRVCLFLPVLAGRHPPVMLLLPVINRSMSLCVRRVGLPRVPFVVSITGKCCHMWHL